MAQTISRGAFQDIIWFAMHYKYTTGVKAHNIFLKRTAGRSWASVDHRNFGRHVPCKNILGN